MGDETGKDTSPLSSEEIKALRNFLPKIETYDGSGVRILTDEQKLNAISSICSNSYTMIAKIENEIPSIKEKAESILNNGVTSGFIGIIFLAPMLYLSVNYMINREYGSSSIYLAIAGLLIFINMEMFSIYSLYSYNKKLNLIKYYRNEITNLLTHLNAIKLCTIYSDADMAKNLIIRLSQIDRNNSFKKSNTR
ncbi:hypothetical protein GH722_01840 [Alphaproteobacteria bacterium HT1-32]|nr:hypothetical protein [Alphaproteobacteria bacterium HT1-32]